MNSMGAVQRKMEILDSWLLTAHLLKVMAWTIHQRSCLAFVSISLDINLGLIYLSLYLSLDFSNSEAGSKSWMQA